MKIAIGTDDQHTIRDGDFVESRHYQILEIRNVQVAARELRNNPYAESSTTGQRSSAAEQVVELLCDCRIFMGKSFGAVKELSAHGIDCIITDTTGINEAIESYLSVRLAGFKYYDADREMYLPCSERV